MSSLQELLAQKAALEQQIAETQRATRADAIAKVRSLMAENGLTAADLVGGVRASAPKASSGKKVAAKYRDNATGQTWSGRGLQPRWLREAIASGKTIESFAV